MSTKMIGVVGRGSGWQKVGIELGSFFFYPNSSQPGMFQTFADSGDQNHQTPLYRPTFVKESTAYFVHQNFENIIAFREKLRKILN